MIHEIPAINWSLALIATIRIARDGDVILVSSDLVAAQARRLAEKADIAVTVQPRDWFYTYFTDAQIGACPDFDQRAQSEARVFLPGYNPADYCWSAPPTDECPVCYKWRRYPPNQRHFGWAWWRVCSQDCACEHHASELWVD